MQRQRKPQVPYKQNSNPCRVRKNAWTALLQIAGGDEEEAKALLIDLGKGKVPSPVDTKLLPQLVSNIHNLFAAIPKHTCVCPAMLSVLTDGLTYQQASNITGYSPSAVEYSHRSGFEPTQVLADISLKVNSFHVTQTLTITDPALSLQSPSG